MMQKHTYIRTYTHTHTHTHTHHTHKHMNLFYTQTLTGFRANVIGTQRPGGGPWS